MPDFEGFEILGLVAEGDIATVWRGRHLDLGRHVAIKELHAAAGNRRILDLFRSEAHRLAELDDPHIVRLYDYVEDGDRSYLVEEWVDGETLEALLGRHGKLTGEQSLGVLRGALMGLAHAHDCALVHGDIAPSNIMIDREGDSRLIDFGLAAPVGEIGGAGTPAFVSPEVIAGEPATAASDVYSCGALLYLLLDGKPPMPGPDLAAVLRQHREEPAPALRGHDDELAALVARALDKDPARRPADARTFLAELEEAARRRYGAGWLTRAPVAGLLASPMVAAVVRTTAGGSATATQPATGATALAIAESGDGDRPRSRKMRGRTLAAAGAAVVIAGIVTALVAAGGSDTKAKDVSAPLPNRSAGAPAASPTAKSAAAAPSVAAAVKASGLVGKYRVSAVATSSTNPADPVGTRRSVVWTIARGCSAAPCNVTISSSSGLTYHATFDGSSLALPSQTAVRTTCVSDQTHQPIPGASTLATTLGISTLKVSGGAKAVRLFGGQNFVISYTAPVGSCRTGAQNEKWQLTATKI
jgi:hypothetical protein